MDRPAAFTQLKLRCAADTDPALSTEELTAILDATLRWSIWAPNTLYAFGALVIPTVRNGHTYKAVVNQQFTPQPEGVSGPVEPIWPLYINPDRHISETRPYWGGFGGPLGHYAVAQVTDNAIIWQEAGPDDADPYDLRKAVYDAWLLKAGKASAHITATFGPDKTWANLVFDHCMLMAHRNAPSGIY